MYNLFLVVLQTHNSGIEETSVHELELGGDFGSESHLAENVLLEVNTGSNLNELKAGVAELEHCALGDVLDFLTVLTGEVGREGDLLNFLDEFNTAIGVDFQTGAGDLDIGLANGEGTHEKDLLGILGNVNVTAGTYAASAELGNVDVTLFVDLSAAEEGHVKNTAIVHIDGIGLREHAFAVCNAGEGEAFLDLTTHGTGLNRAGEAFINAFFCCNGANTGGHAGTEVNDDIGLELHSCATGNDLAQGHGQDLGGVAEEGLLAAQLGTILEGGIALTAVHRILCNNDVVNQLVVDADVTGAESSAGNNLFNLSNDNTAVIVGGNGNFQFSADIGLVLHGEVSVLVGIGGTDESHVGRGSLVEEILFAVDVHKLNNLKAVLCLLVESAAIAAGIGKGVKTDLGDETGTAAGGTAEEVAHNAHGRHIAGNFISIDHVGDGTGIGHVAGPYAAQQTGNGDFVCANIVSLVGLGALGLVAGSDAAYEGDILRMTLALKTLLKTGVEFFRRTQRTKAAGNKSAIIGNQAHCFFKSNKLGH